MLVSETTDFSGVGCVSTSNVLIFTENTPPVFTLLAPANQTVCTIDGATSVAVYGISLDNSKVTDNCTAFSNLLLTYTISGATTGSGSNLSEGTIFNLGTSTITYTATDQGGNLSTHSITIIVNQSPAAITISHSVVSGGGTGILPNQCGVYNYSVDGGTPAGGYTYAWNVYAGGTATGTPVLSFGNLATIQITWSGDLAPGTYTIEAKKTSGANSCNSKSTLQITLQNSFNLFVNDPGNDCKGESLGSKIINWEVGRNCGSTSYSFTYVIAAGNYNTLADAQAHAISGMPVTVTSTSDNPKIIYQTVDYGTGGDFYTTQVFTLFIYNQIDGNGQPDINSADDFQHFFLKAIPNTTDISTN
jgi:hypothetical protein